jgi:hypothetical protein
MQTTTTKIASFIHKANTKFNLDFMDVFSCKYLERICLYIHMCRLKLLNYVVLIKVAHEKFQPKFFPLVRI